MNLQKPLEGLLRPPLEWISSASFFVTGLWCWVDHYHLIMCVFICLSVLRFKQGLHIWRYQKKLKYIPNYEMSENQLPVSQKQLFLGKGFLWTAKHTQRLRDLDLEYNLSFKTKAQTAVGGEPALHGVAENEKDIFVHLVERASHLLVLGLPGVGKTRFAEMLIGQDIRRGDVVIVLDPKGDLDLLKRMAIEANISNREKDLLILHLGFPEHSCRYNPIGNFTRVTEVANRISNQLPGSGDSQAFKEFGWQFINSIAMALVAMGEVPDYKKMRFYITKMDILLERYLNFWLKEVDNHFEEWVNDYIKKKSTPKKALERLKALIAYVEQHDLIQNPIFDDLNTACRYNREYFSKITASLGPLLKKLTTGKAAELLSPNLNDTNDHRPILNWYEVIKHKKIVYVGLDALSDPAVAAAVGNAMFSDLTSTAGRLYKFGLDNENQQNLPRTCLHSDEFNEIIGDEFIPLLNKSRGAGFTVTAYTQTWSDVEARLKSRAKAGQVAGNIGTVILFRCKEAATVELFLSQLPTVPILRIIPTSSVSDTSHGENDIYFRSSNSDQLVHSEQRLIEQNDVLNLPKGQAFCLLEGGKLYKLRVPLPKRETFSLPDNIDQIIQQVHANYLSH